MRVLFVSSEVHPLIKTGGLADVAGSLPGALCDLGLDVRVLMPGYQSILQQLALTTCVAELPLLPGLSGSLLEGALPCGTRLWVIQCDALYARPGGPYQAADGAEWPDNAQRFGALSRVAATLCGGASPLDWRPQLLHCNDWQTGLAPAYLAFESHTDHVAERVTSLFTIHNLAYAGLFDASHMASLLLPPQDYQIEGYEFYGQISFLKAGLHYADGLSTVSPSYAREIREPQFGAGFDGLLNARVDRLSGILNGIDDVAWDPCTDPALPKPYSLETIEAKAENKRLLLEKYDLEFDPNVPLAVIISRLTEQKGLDLVIPAMHMLEGRSMQLLVLGTGDPVLTDQFAELEQSRPASVRFLPRYDETLAHWMEGAADIFLMPSRFEPCGLNQMYSMRYGTIPIVHRTGGLADTVIDTTPSTLAEGLATGFVFDESQPQYFGEALCRALDFYQDNSQWRELQRAGMTTDFSWSKSAQAYVELYERLRNLTS